MTKAADDFDYRVEDGVDLEEIRELYRRSTLGERRPIDDAPVFEQMIRHADLLVTARRGHQLVGVARTLTDFGYVAYLADLAVDAAFQRRGIGKRLIAETRTRLGPRCLLVLLAAPKAKDYYAPLGFEPHPRAWTLRGDQPLR